MNKRMLYICGWALGVLTLAQLASAGEFALNQVDIHGFISQGFLKSDRNNVFAETKDGTFQFDEFGLTFSTNLSEQLHTGLQLFARDLGDIGDNEITLDWAYADYRWRDWLGLRAGKIKIPYGFYNETRDIDLVRTSIFLPPSLYYEGDRDKHNTLLGAGVYGNLNLASFGDVNYQFQIGETNISSNSSAVKYAQDANESLLQMEVKRQYTAHVEWDTPLAGLRLGGFAMQTDLSFEFESSETSEANTSNPENADASTSPDTSTSPDASTSADTSESPSDSPPNPEEQQRCYILSAEYEWDRLVLTGEYLFPPDAHGAQGYYLGAAYRVTDRLEFGAYYSVYYQDADDKDGKKRQERGMADYSAWQKEFVASVRLDLNEHWTFKVEGHVINGTAQILTQDNPQDIREKSSMLAIKTTYHF